LLWTKFIVRTDNTANTFPFSEEVVSKAGLMARVPAEV